MVKVLDGLGSLAGVVGLIACLVSGGMRLAGRFYLYDTPLVTVFLAGAGLVLAACYLKLEAGSLGRSV